MSTTVPYALLHDVHAGFFLQDSLGGTAQAVVITNLAPEESQYRLTYTTLNFANKTRTVVNKPVVNEVAEEPVAKKARVEMADADSSSGGADDSARGKSRGAAMILSSLTPLRQSMMSPINRNRQDITTISDRMRKLESLLERTSDDASSDTSAHLQTENISPDLGELVAVRFVLWKNRLTVCQ